MRTLISREYTSESKITVADRAEIWSALEDAFYFSLVVIYAQGMHLLQKGSVEMDYRLRLADIARIWRGGCIIRASFLEQIYSAYKQDPELKHLLLDKEIKSKEIL